MQPPSDGTPAPLLLAAGAKASDFDVAQNPSLHGTQPVLLFRVFKSERIVLSADRLTAASSMGYRMVRATHGVASGAWYFEVKVMHLGHTCLGWATNMADIDMPVGCGAYGFGYRDSDGAKVHMSWRDKYVMKRCARVLHLSD
ncbi:unnamed protein product [Miscanthus lutarioriparius]|uniref:B30.2/SPRY domain-containing protein n=1 Tax=Miscanthus lutarioriparius TaxID=422564 RepID=A0A811RG70_9POAL|nr:unnamed protein product [Miscanthus lutarioriparius]